MFVITTMTACATTYIVEPKPGIAWAILNLIAETMPGLIMIISVRIIRKMFKRLSGSIIRGRDTLINLHIFISLILIIGVITRNTSFLLAVRDQNQVDRCKVELATFIFGVLTRMC